MTTPITLVSSNGVTSGTGAVSSLSIPLTPTAGNALILVIPQVGTTSGAITAGNITTTGATTTWTVVTSIGSLSLVFDVWCSNNVPSGITAVNFGGVSPARIMSAYVAEVSGLTAATFIADQHGASSATSASMQASFGVKSEPSDLVLAAFTCKPASGNSFGSGSTNYIRDVNGTFVAALTCNLCVDWCTTQNFANPVSDTVSQSSSIAYLAVACTFRASPSPPARREQPLDMRPYSAHHTSPINWGFQQSPRPDDNVVASPAGPMSRMEQPEDIRLYSLAAIQPMDWGFTREPAPANYSPDFSGRLEAPLDLRNYSLDALRPINWGFTRGPVGPSNPPRVGPQERGLESWLLTPRPVPQDFQRGPVGRNNPPRIASASLPDDRWWWERPPVPRDEQQGPVGLSAGPRQASQERGLEAWLVTPKPLPQDAQHGPVGPDFVVQRIASQERGLDAWWLSAKPVPHDWQRGPVGPSLAVVSFAGSARLVHREDQQRMAILIALLEAE